MLKFSAVISPSAPLFGEHVRCVLLALFAGAGTAELRAGTTFPGAVEVKLKGYLGERLDAMIERHVVATDVDYITALADGFDMYSRYPRLAASFCDYASAGNQWRRANHYRTWFDAEHRNDD